MLQNCVCSNCAEDGVFPAALNMQQNEIDEEVLESRFSNKHGIIFSIKLYILRLADVSAVLHDESVLECDK